jgi:2-phosphoglycerate kinase
MEEGDAVWAGVIAFIENSYPWKEFIVEGVGILPHLVAKSFSNNEQVKTVFLVDENADRIRNTIFTRGLFDDAKTYSDDVKEKEVEWALLFSHTLKKEIERYGYPMVEVSKNEDDLSTILKILGYS